MLQKVSISKLKSNPHRGIDEYPIQQDKVAALEESIRATGVWPSVIARKVGEFFEIAFGHHRVVAMENVLGPRGIVPILVQKLNDEQMIKMMVHENNNEYRSSAYVHLQSVQAVVRAYAAGVVTLGEPSKDIGKKYLRHAPSFKLHDVGDGDPQRPYTARTVAAFIGCGDSEGKCKKTAILLNALELIERGALKADSFVGLGISAAEALVKQEMASWKAAQGEAKALQRLGKDAEAKAVIKEAKQDIQQSSKATAIELRDNIVTATKKARQVKNDIQKRNKTPKPPPNIDVFADKLATKLNNMLEEDDPILLKIQELIKWKSELHPAPKKMMAKALFDLASRCTKYANNLTDNKKKLISASN